MYVQKIPWEANYDESEMPVYPLPELLPPGIDSREKWEKIRRPELLRLFEEVMYGELPPMPDRVRYELLSEKPDALGGRALRREVRLHFEMNDGRVHHADMLCYIPAARPAPAPVFVGLTFVGNHVVTAEPDVRITGLAYDDGAHELDRTRGVQVRRFPFETILGRGYAVAVASYHDFFPDRIDGWEQSIYRLFYSGDTLKRGPGHSSIGAWAWGLSRMLDSLAAMPEIDKARAAVFGHSRLGKTSLWAGVTDPRFKVVCVNDSGCGGAALSRRLYGETLFSMCNRNDFGHFWFTDTLAAKSEHPETLPVDQHELVALVAPRPVAVHSATEDQWADPTGEYLAAYHAGPVWELYGKTPLASATPPAPDRAVGTDVSYFLRTGKHDLLLSDWIHYMDVADREFGRSAK